MSRKEKLGLGITVIILVAVVTFAAIILHERTVACGYKTLDENGELTDRCTDRPVRWCSSEIEVLLDDNANQLKPALLNVLGVYQPYTVNLNAWDDFDRTEAAPYNTIRISVSETLDPEVDGYAAKEQTRVNPNTGCMINSHIIMIDDISWYDEEMFLCHEFGHALGLTHSTFATSPMFDPPGGTRCRTTERMQNALLTLIGYYED